MDLGLKKKSARRIDYRGNLDEFNMDQARQKHEDRKTASSEEKKRSWANEMDAIQKRKANDIPNDIAAVTP